MEQAHLLNRVRTSHWLERSAKQKEGERGTQVRARQWEVRPWERQCSFLFFFSCLRFLTSLPKRLWRARPERGKHKVRDGEGKAERIKGGAHVRDCVEHALSCWCDCHRLSNQRCRLSEKKKVFQWNESLNRFTMWMWDSNFQTFAGRIPRKKEQGPESRAGPAGWPPVNL